MFVHAHVVVLNSKLRNGYDAIYPFLASLLQSGETHALPFPCGGLPFIRLFALCQEVLLLACLLCKIIAHFDFIFWRFQRSKDPKDTVYNGCQWHYLQ